MERKEERKREREKQQNDTAIKTQGHVYHFNKKQSFIERGNCIIIEFLIFLNLFFYSRIFSKSCFHILAPVCDFFT